MSCPCDQLRVDCSSPSIWDKGCQYKHHIIYRCASSLNIRSMAPIFFRITKYLDKEIEVRKVRNKRGLGESTRIWLRVGT